MIRFRSVPKVTIKNFKEQILRIKASFSKSKIIYIGIHSNIKVNNERPNTYQDIINYNKILKEEFKEYFIDDGIFSSEQDYTEDGYHLNKNGHLKLAKKLINFFNK